MAVDGTAEVGEQGGASRQRLPIRTERYRLRCMAPSMLLYSLPSASVV